MTYNKGEHLKKLLEHNLCPLPVQITRKDGEVIKKPATDGWTSFQSLPTEEQINSWWPHNTYGIVCGRISGNLEIMDFDEKYRKGIFEDWKKLLPEEGIATLKKCVITGTINKGNHVLYYCDEIGRNVHLAQSKNGDVWIETRSEGGFTIEPPTPEYSYIQGHLSSIPKITPEERALFLQTAILLNEFVKPIYVPKPKHSLSKNEERPGDNFHNRATWEEILQPEGWKIDKQYPDGVVHWTRPGKKCGTSATTNFKGLDLFHVFSSSTLFDPDKSYNKFQVYAFLKHNGDFKAAAKDLANKGYGKKKETSHIQEQYSPINQNKDENELVSECIANITMEPIEWLWPGKLAKGKLSIIGGNPGLGKSQITLSMAACITRGIPFPCTDAKPKIGSVLLFSTEDDPADTIGPRLEANGADRSKVHVVFSTKREGKEKHFNLEEDADLLAKKIQQIGDVALVIIDPMSAYLGKADSFKDSIVRSMLAPFSRVANNYRAAFLGLMHLRKNGSGDPVQQFIGSIAFAGAARAAYVVLRDEHDEKRRLMVCAKNNLAEDATGLAYRIEPYEFVHNEKTIQTSRVTWETEQLEMTASEAMQQAKRADKQTESKITEAQNFLYELLKDKPDGMQSVIIKQQADLIGIAEKTLHRAKNNMYIKVEQRTDNVGRQTWWKLE